MNRKLTIICFAAIALLATSCGTYKRQAYLQDMQADSIYAANTRPESRIVKDDILSIVVTCSSPELAAPFNIVSGAAVYDDNTGLAKVDVTAQTDRGYTVDNNGNITFPVLGELHVEGLTLNQVKEKVEDQLRNRNFIRDPIVLVDFLNFEITMLGEVNKVGTYRLPREGANLFQVLAMAGDLTDNAVRNEIWVIRTEDDVRHLYTINPQSSECLTSPAFYMQQNDMIYVKPKDTKFDQTVQNRLTIFEKALSILSTASTVYLWLFVYSTR